MALFIECEYCGSVFDCEKESVCPNCTAAPDMERISAARKAEEDKAKALRAEVHAARMEELAARAKLTAAPTGKLMSKLIKLIPVWVIIILICGIVPAIVSASVSNAVRNSLQTIDSAEITEHEFGEDVSCGDMFNIAVDGAFFAESDAVKALLPENVKLLVVHISASSENIDRYSSIFNDYDREIYIGYGDKFAAPVSVYSLSALKDDFAQKRFYLSSLKYSNSESGYICYLVDEETEDISLYFDETHSDGYVQQLDRIHKIPLVISKEGEE